MSKLNDEVVADLMMSLATGITDYVVEYAETAVSDGATEEEYNAAIYATLTALVIGFSNSMNAETLAAAKELIQQAV